MTTPESLTAEERAAILGASVWAEKAITKLLRIHDRQVAEVKELQRYVATQDAVARVRTDELEAENATLRTLLLAWLEWGAAEASGFDRVAINLGERTLKALRIDEDGNPLPLTPT